MSRSRPIVAVLVATAVAALACGDAAPIRESPSTGEQPACDVVTPAALAATGTSCPPAGTALRFTGGAPPDFGRSFTSSYCTRCHATALTGAAARNGAPAGANFDDVCSIRARVQIMDAYAGSGANGTFTIMPIGPPAPTLAERARLSEWLACGAP
jgi:cytochrome c5